MASINRAIPTGLLDVLGDAVIYIDPAGRVIYWNPAATELFGYQAADMLGHTPAAVFPGATAEGPASGHDFKGQWRSRRKDGTEVWVEVQATTVRDPSGEPIGSLVVSRDISGRLSAEAALGSSEGRFRALAETASDGIVSIDVESTILFANAGLGRIFGYSADELVGRELTLLMPDYLRHLHRAGMERYLQTGVRHIHWASTELPGRHREGYTIPLDISFGESRLGGRHIFTGIVRDVTHRKRIERRLTIENTVAHVLGGAHSEAPVLTSVLGELGRALDWQWGGLWVLDEPTGSAIRCVEFWAADAARYAEFVATSRALRLAPGEGLPGRVWATGAPAWVSDVLNDPNFARSAAASKLGLHAGVAFPIQRRGETHAVLEFLAERVEEPDPELLGLMTTVGAQVGQFLERRRAETALRRSEERYRSLVQATAQLVWTCDPVGNIVEEQPSWNVYTGQAFEAYRGFGWSEAVHLDDREPLLAAWQAAVAHRQPLRETEARIRGADGKYGFFSIRGVPIFDAAGELCEWVGACTDVTARRQQEERLRQADRMEAVGRLAGGVAHEANNQMSVVLGSAEFVLRRADLPEAVRQDVEYVRQAAERTAVITAQLLAFSRRQLLQPKLLALDAEVLALEPILRRALGAAHTLVVRTGGVDGSVRADPGQLAQVLLNLTFNSRDAMPDGGTLTIRTRTVSLSAEQAAAHPAEEAVPGTYALLSVSDTGHGMDRATLARVFEPFFTTKPVGQGTGLGLASVHGIVRQSGGHVWAYSEPGLGTTFEIHLPLVQAPAERDQVAAPASGGRGTGTVLVAEDEPVLRGMIARTLRERGYTVLEAADGEEALALARSWSEPLDLAVADVVMPRMNGHTLARHLRHAHPGVRVLFISGFPDQEAIERGLVMGGEPFLQKPFGPEALAATVASLLAPDVPTSAGSTT